MSLCQREQSARKRLEPKRIGIRQGESQGEGQRIGANRGQIRQIDRQRLVPQRLWIGVGQEVPAFNQHVGGDGDLLSGGRRWQQRAVVPHAEIGPRDGAGEIAGDQVEFAEWGWHDG
ncbi:hypothetical protein GALL_461080 [mine drainage metagenome]|uniref:Uncharacterized protein n=1 Tax=mine drainage metagenome TaxID=410659 RepID=A0A1J5PM61_9ZZZZ